ncbi:MAG: dephospho-CoA kinase, partial [Bacteroidetes bacterium]|nr:dephospho-CoA kinase [Bacteroidota bacterium]
MIRVALTGNIGTGKSTVCRIFESLGVPVYHADEEAKKFLSEKGVRETLIEKFGGKIKTGNEISRKKLAEKVFKDDQALEFLNSIIHPLVKNDLKGWIAKHQNHQYIIQEAAILFESGFDKEFDKIITVISPPGLAMQRVLARDKISVSDVKMRMDRQWDQERKRE